MASRVDCLIFSKDRACQLDLLLRSIALFFKNVGNIYIIYTFSNDKFFDAYDRINIPSALVHSIVWVEQKNFENEVKEILYSMDSKYILGLCDDDVFVKETDCSKIINKLHEENVSAISLKAGLNIVGNYPNFKFVLPDFIEKDEFLKWVWRECDSNSDWGYPTCINSYIYLKDYFLNLINTFSFQNPTHIEGGLNLRKSLFRDYMISFKDSKLMNTPVNRIQKSSDNPFGQKYFYTVDALNQLFLSGKQISLNTFINYPMTMGNEEVKFIFEGVI